MQRTQSHLSARIGLCESIETLSDDECIKVMRLLREKFKYKNLNQFLMNIVLQMIKTMKTDILMDIFDSIKSISIKTDNVNNQSKTKKNSQNNKKQLLFPLLDLPIDFIIIFK